MEDNYTPNEAEYQNAYLAIRQESVRNLRETAKWAKVLGIIGFIGIAFTILLGFSFGSIMSMFMETEDFDLGGGLPYVFIGVVYTVFGLLYLFPTYYLYSYGSKLKSALDQSDEFLLEEAFKNQRSLYRFMGIFTLIILGLYAFILVGSFLASYALGV